VKARKSEGAKLSVLFMSQPIGMNKMSKTKPFGISKESIMAAWKKVKANLYKLWNRMSSGSYFPPPVKVVDIPKSDGSKRRLGIPTVADRVAQAVVKDRLEQLVEPKFHENSYGYRPRKSAVDAVGVTRQRCWKKDWVIDLDIKGFFDNMDHDLVMKAVRHHTEEKWVTLYIERWLKAPMQLESGEVVERTRGTPQGGVISPLLANLFMHYVFDVWLQKKFPNCPFARYADDGVPRAQWRLYMKS
jgi:RNA-directed DNA polymerase